MSNPGAITPISLVFVESKTGSGATRCRVRGSPGVLPIFPNHDSEAIIFGYDRLKTDIVVHSVF